MKLNYPELYNKLAQKCPEQRRDTVLNGGRILMRLSRSLIGLRERRKKSMAAKSHVRGREVVLTKSAALVIIKALLEIAGLLLWEG